MDSYDHQKIERKWQERWRSSGLYKTSEDRRKKKFYALDMFPYPSGEGLHVGHPRGYIATDIYARYKRMNGYSVLHPMGWDAFGLPAENFAIKHKIHPRVSVEKNIQRYREQLNLIGFSYDWDREINTTDPSYYRWTQWIFLKMFQHGLAYESYEPINWCPSCLTGLASEDLDGDRCERCGTKVRKKPLRQWVLKITDYADRLINDIEGLRWPESIKESQRNWIGRSEGALLRFKIEERRSGESRKIGEVEVFTTRPDTLFGATYVVLAPEHPILKHIEEQGISLDDEVKHYIESAIDKTEVERSAEKDEKTGIQVNGIVAVNPANKEAVPVFLADYVLPCYGTGAIMAVPAHDERDFVFANKFGLPIRVVITGGDISKEAYAGSGSLINSEKFSGLSSEEAKKAITRFVGGAFTVKYKLRDWIFSRQRYWGEPIPLVFCTVCKALLENFKKKKGRAEKWNKGELINPGWIPIPEEELPLKLPEVSHYKPTKTGESPLAGIIEWVNTVCPRCGAPARRETNTMPQWAGSCWYYLRYEDPQSDKKPVSKEREKYWSPVDLYVGGAEHATRHLIYARFWHKFLFDIGVVYSAEPFLRFQNVGLIQGADGRKMSKRYGNVVNPDEIVERWGADTLRLYEMFMGPFDQTINWGIDSLRGPRRFLERLWRMQEKIKQEEGADNGSVVSLYHLTVKKVSLDIEGLRFNTAVSALMIFLNALEREEVVSRECLKGLILLLAPFAPHITEELWERFGECYSIHEAAWPIFDKVKITVARCTLAVQVNGKLRATFEIEGELSAEEAKDRAMALPAIRRWVGNKIPKRVIYVPKRLINIVI